MRKPWRSTFGLVALAGTLFAIATLIVGTVAVHVTHEALEVQLNQRIALEVQALLNEGHRGSAGIAAAIRRRDAARSTASLDYLLLDPAGHRLAGGIDLHSPIVPGYTEFLHYSRDNRPRSAQSLTIRLPDSNILIVAADRSVIYDMDDTLRRLFRMAFGALLLLGIGAAWLVGAVTRARLARIDKTALAIIDGDLAQRMPLTGAGDEFDRVSSTLNRMLDRIGRLMDNLRQVSSDVAHDLRTPLTRLNNRLEEALASDDPVIAGQAIADARAQSQELLDIFASLLRIAEVEGFAARSHFRTIDLGAVIDEMLDTYRPDLEARGHSVQSNLGEAVRIQGDRRLLQQLVTNLLDNVMRHTSPGTAVTVSLTQGEGQARLTVADDGPGMPPEDASRLFQRFTRAEHSRSSEGHGLGLALVAAIASAHRGTATLAAPPGFAIIVALPLAG
jgi:signal transduction histidine kinase